MGGGWRHEDRDEMADEDGSREDVDVFPGVTCMRDSGKALLCLFPEWGGDRGVEVLVPQSMISSDSEVYKDGQRGKLVVKAWWTEKALAEHKERKKKDALRRAAVAGRVRAAHKAEAAGEEQVCVQCGVVLPDGVNVVWGRAVLLGPAEPYCSQACFALRRGE